MMTKPTFRTYLRLSHVGLTDVYHAEHKNSWQMDAHPQGWYYIHIYTYVCILLLLCIFIYTVFKSTTVHRF